MLDFLDHIRYDIVQTQETPYIREPLLLADIAVARPLYWPGHQEGKRMLEDSPEFQEFSQKFMNEEGLFISGKVNSDFCAAYAALKSDIGREYAKKANARFLDRQIGGITVMRLTRKDPKKGMPEVTYSLFDKKMSKS